MEFRFINELPVLGSLRKDISLAMSLTELGESVFVRLSSVC